MNTPIESMTGYGEHRAKISGVTVICRARSLNHRFLDVKLRLPRTDLMSLDVMIRKRLTEIFKRGSIEITLLTETSREAQNIAFNPKTAEAYVKGAKLLAKKLKLKSKGLYLEALIRLPGVVSTGSSTEEQLTTSNDQEILKLVIEPVLKKLKAARQNEGQKLAAFILTHLDEMESHVNGIRLLEKTEKEKARTQIIERAEETLKLLSSLNNKPASEEFSQRLKEEAVFWVERRDFDEERSRLGMHLKEFRSLVTGVPGTIAESAGRKLEFMQQEILREINTLGTKAQSQKITKHTIELKTILERVREQLANVE